MSKEYLKLNRQRAQHSGVLTAGVGRGTGLRVVGVMIQIGKAVLGDFNRGLTRLFQRSQGKVLLYFLFF